MGNGNNRAFTLVELLMVISIIALLSSIVLGSLSEARIKARDSARISFLLELQKAVELYASDHGGSFPFNYYGGGYACLYCDGVGNYDNTGISDPPVFDHYLKLPLSLAENSKGNSFAPVAFAACAGKKGCGDEEEGGGSTVSSDHPTIWFTSRGEDYKLSLVGIEKPEDIPPSMRDDFFFPPDRFSACEGKVISVWSADLAKTWSAPIDSPDPTERLSCN